MVDVEQSALRTFKQQVLTCFVGSIQSARHINNHRLDQFGIGHRLRQHGSIVDGFGAQILRQDEIMVIEVFLELFGEALGVE